MLRILVLLTVCLAGTGCRSVFSAKPATLPVTAPESWSVEGTTESQPNGWLRDFDDLRLESLVDEAIGQNFDLRAAYARLEQAAATHHVARADYWPTLEGEFGVGRSRRNSVVNDDVIPSRTTSHDLGLVASWELDVWGRVRSQATAAAMDFEAAQADLAAARLSVAGHVSRAWFNLQAATAELALAHQTLASFQAAQAIIEERYTDGLTTALDVHLGRASVSAARSRVEVAKRQTDGFARSLEVLIGRYPQGKLSGPGVLPEVLQSVPAGVPSALLERRPDLVAARQSYLSTLATTEAARKNRLPAFRLTASGGTSSEELENLLNIHYLVWNLAAGITQPIFNAGELAARVDLAEAQSNEALARYAQTVLGAYQEVETSLAAETWLVQQEAALRDAVTESEQAEEIALDQYNRGLVVITTLLDAQRRVFEARSSLIQLRNLRVQNRINLHLALGGDFAATASQP